MSMKWDGKYLTNKLAYVDLSDGTFHLSTHIAVYKPYKENVIEWYANAVFPVDGFKQMKNPEFHVTYNVFQNVLWQLISRGRFL